jgi:hypothetical protein
VSAVDVCLARLKELDLVIHEARTDAAESLVPKFTGFRLFRHQGSLSGVRDHNAPFINGFPDNVYLVLEPVQYGISSGRGKLNGKSNMWQFLYQLALAEDMKITHGAITP